MIYECLRMATYSIFIFESSDHGKVSRRKSIPKFAEVYEIEGLT